MGWRGRLDEKGVNVGCTMLVSPNYLHVYK